MRSDDRVRTRLALFVVLLAVVSGGLLLGGVIDTPALSDASTTDDPTTTAATSAVATTNSTTAIANRSATTVDAESTANPSVATPAIIGPPPVTNTTAALDMLDVNEVWPAFNTTGEGVTIAVLDAGVAADQHPSLAPPADGWVDFVGNSTDPLDETGHGTLTSGVLVGNETAAGTRYGVAPGASLIHARIIDADGDARTSNVLRALDWAIDHPREPDVIVINIGEQTRYESYIDAIEAARAAGITVVVPVGNNGDGVVTAPGNVYSGLSVGATTDSAAVANYSGGGIISTRATWGTGPIYQYDWPESYVAPAVVAPGTTTIAAEGGGFRRASGTSVAAPHVAGTVALMQAASDRQLTPAEIDRALLSTARYPGESPPDTRYGYGSVDTAAAVAAVADRPPYFEITRIAYDEPVARGERVEFTATVENVGNETATQLVVMRVDGKRFGSRLLTLDGGETATLRRAKGVTCIEAASRQSSITIRTDNTSLTAPVEVCAV